MTTFFTFYKRRQSQLLLENKTSLPDTIASDAMKAAIPGILTGNKKEERFRALAISVASDDEFLSSFSEAIGDPRETETEDEFVDRAKAQLTVMLKKKLKVK